LKILTLIARLLLGLMFTVFGANSVHFFMGSMPPLPPGLPGEFSHAMLESHYTQVVGVLMVISGLLFLINRYVPVALVILGPILFNILLFHALMLHKGFEVGVVAAILWFIVFYAYRAAFAGIFAAKA
jgi:putative oxidoreductase